MVWVIICRVWVINSLFGAIVAQFGRFISFMVDYSPVWQIRYFYGRLQPRLADSLLLRAITASFGRFTTFPGDYNPVWQIHPNFRAITTQFGRFTPPFRAITTQFGRFTPNFGRLQSSLADSPLLWAITA
ncbi:hypothetical protein [Ornithinibacillus halotolerans]|uniref:hypothetical protein n=1 Tax=Ornithinibacillus halotolerans TaxID=1274357 RepID=UPI00166B027E|nr:hypothetical protein [Ornithinibacillus halotolerans]